MSSVEQYHLPTSAAEDHCGPDCPLDELGQPCVFDKMLQGSAVSGHLQDLVANGGSHSQYADILRDEHGMSAKALMAAKACARCIFEGGCPRYGYTPSVDRSSAAIRKRTQ